MTPTRILLDRIVDYAGLFPPAGLDMDTALRNFAEYRRGDDAWMLGRFIVPATRLGELAERLGAIRPAPRRDEPWLVSCLIATVETDVERIEAFRSMDHAGVDVAVDTVEIRVDSADAVERLPSTLATTFSVFVETPLDADLEETVAAIGRRGFSAKVRTGGVTPDAFPAPADLARFIGACHRSGVPFKATAGLHHPLRSEHALTYERGSPKGVMHGFLNVFVAAAFTHIGAGTDTIEAILEEEAASAFVFDDDGMSWRGQRVESGQLADSRRRTAISFGSCSFTEPVDDLRGIGVI